MRARLVAENHASDCLAAVERHDGISRQAEGAEISSIVGACGNDASLPVGGIGPTSAGGVDPGAALGANSVRFKNGGNECDCQ